MWNVVEQFVHCFNFALHFHSHAWNIDVVSVRIVCGIQIWSSQVYDSLPEDLRSRAVLHSLVDGLLGPKQPWDYELKLQPVILNQGMTWPVILVVFCWPGHLVTIQSSLANKTSPSGWWFHGSLVGLPELQWTMTWTWDFCGQNPGLGLCCWRGTWQNLSSCMCLVRASAIAVMTWSHMECLRNLLSGLLRNFCVVALDEDHSSETVCLMIWMLPMVWLCLPTQGSRDGTSDTSSLCLALGRSAPLHSGPFQPSEFHGKNVSGIAVLRVGPSEMPAAK